MDQARTGLQSFSSLMYFLRQLSEYTRLILKDVKHNHHEGPNREPWASAAPEGPLDVQLSLFHDFRLAMPDILLPK